MLQFTYNSEQLLATATKKPPSSTNRRGFLLPSDRVKRYLFRLNKPILALFAIGGIIDRPNA